MHSHPITDFHHIQGQMGEAQRQAEEARLVRSTRRPARRSLALPRLRRRRTPVAVAPRIVVLTE